MATAIERNPIRNRGLQMIPYGSHEEWLGIPYDEAVLAAIQK